MEQKKEQKRADFILAIALILGALVLAVISLKLPSHIAAPMTADMDGIVEEVYESYEGTRISIKLQNNSVKFTMPIETFEQLDAVPAVGDNIHMKYELTSYREIRMMEIEDENGKEMKIFEQPNPLLEKLNRMQLTAFAVFGVYMVICFLIHAKKRKEK